MHFHKNRLDYYNNCIIYILLSSKYLHCILYLIPYTGKLDKVCY